MTATTRAPQPVLHRAPDRLAGSLQQRLAEGATQVAVTFAGQGVDAFAELVALVGDRPEHLAAVEMAADVLRRSTCALGADLSGLHPSGWDLAGWVADPERAPGDAELRSSAVSQPLVLLTQALVWRTVVADGLGPALDAGAVVATTGHSQGLLAAVMVAEGPMGTIDDDRLERYLRVAHAQGLAMAEARTAPSPLGTPPMAAIHGITPARLDAELEVVNAGRSPGDTVSVGLRNAPRRVVVTGAPTALDALRARLVLVAEEEARQRKEGRRGGAVLRTSWHPVAVEVPFHSPHQDEPRRRFVAWARSAGLLPSGDDLAVPVLSTVDGRDLRGEDLVAALAEEEFTAVVDWPRTARAAVAHGADWVLDVGPGVEVARCSTDSLRGTGARVLALASPEGRRVLAAAGAAPAHPDIRYADLAPRVVELRDGSRHLDNRYTRATGQPPIVLAGMTPTTADAGIVAAAASAGYGAELAGGGQPTRRIFESRCDELVELLRPGAGFVLNSLLLDRPLWDLHVEGEAVLFAARRAGVPLRGLTVSAGVPEVEEAVALLDRLRAAGMVQNAFKPGTADQVSAVLAIADAAPHHTVFVHLEGGKGGGHHSWEDLDDLLLETYHELRRRPNVVLLVAGGVAEPAQATALLTGSWSLTHGEAPMPVDGVLVGTAAMACAEATASPQVKAALLAAAGTRRWVPWKGAEGGITSGRSALNADIHCLDNTAARVAHLLEAVAGSPEQVADRHDEIAEALSHTAKPWFGDLSTMTYEGLLQRFVELCAIGRHRRHDDGAWGDPSWRRRALALFRRAAARTSDLDEGTIASPVAGLPDLDDPRGALARFVAELPAAADTLLHPADADHFLEVCNEPGKPVPFVPVIDSEVRRWYLADALWQAQDDRYPADAVMVIPGPEGVVGIDRVDEPVSDLLARFEAHTVAEVARRTDVERRASLLDGGSAPEPLRRAATGHSGALAELLARPDVLAGDGSRVLPNPLWRLVRPGDTIEVEVVAGDGTDTRPRLVALTARPDGGSGEVLTAREVEGRIEVHLDLPGVPDGRTPVVLHATPHGDGAFRQTIVDPLGTARRALGLIGPDADGGSDVEVVAPWRLDPERIAAHGRLTAAGPGGVPLDIAYALGWPALAGLLGREPVGSHLSRLVHRTHEVEPGPAWPPGPEEEGIATARLLAVSDHVSGTEVTCRVELSSERGTVASLHESMLLVGGDDPGLHRWRRTEDRRLVTDDDALAVLLEQRWVVVRDEVTSVPATVVSTVESEQLPGGGVRHRARGTVAVGDRVIAEISLDEVVDHAEHPVEAAFAVLAPEATDPRPRPRRLLASASSVTPTDLRPFAAVGGDHNPLHRCTLAARLAGLEEPIVHGSWTSARAAAFVVGELADGDGSRLRRWQVRFEAPVALGAPIELRAVRTGIRDGDLVVEVEIAVDEVVVAIGEAQVVAASTALAFPGQGVQRATMGADGRRRSAAARRVWARADAWSRSALGISLVQVVDENPTVLAGPDGALRHPSGVLFRTELTQPALVALAAAQVAELDEAGARSTLRAAAGHSVGEFSALVALGVLPLEAALQLVHLRGLAMQRHVPREADGTSRYRMAVVDPSLVEGGTATVEDAVRAVAEARGEVLEIVNLNAAGRQYAIAGTVDGVAELTGRLPRAVGRQARDAVRPVPGIDVPFHSSVLAPAADEMRGHLERLVPSRIDPDLLVARWVPNLLGRPFALDDEVLGLLGTGIGPAEAIADPAQACRAALVELLARQVAAPVRWIETQQALATIGCAVVVEVGPATSTVLSDLAASSDDPRADGPRWLHVERDRDVVLHRDEPPSEPGPDEGPVAGVPSTPTPPAVSTPPTPPPPSGTGRLDGADRPVDSVEALRAVLALQARVRPDQLRPDETLDDLFGGASSRRNQVLIDLGRELGLTGTEGLHELPIGRLLADLPARTGGYRFPGPYLGDAVAAGVVRALGRAGLARSDALTHLTSTWGAGPGVADHVLLRLTLDSRPGPSTRGGALGPAADALPADAASGRALLDATVRAVADELGLTVATATSTDTADPAIDPARADHLSGALLAAARQLADELGRPFPVDGVPLGTTTAPELDRLDTLDLELGEERSTLVTPRFDHRRHVRFDAPSSFVRWDLVAGWNDVRSGRRPLADLGPLLDRVARHAAEAPVADTVTWLAERAEDEGHTALSTALRRCVGRHRPPLLPAEVQPSIEITDDGRVLTVETPTPGRRDGLVERLLADASGAARAAAPVTGRGPEATAPGRDVDPDRLAVELRRRLEEAPDLRSEIALVTGASPGSIGAALVAQLLAGGATVILTTTDDGPGRRRWYRDLFHRSSAPGAALHVVPANLASFADIDALVGWLGAPEIVQRSRPDLALDPLVPTLVAPFAAVSTTGDARDAGASSELALRVQLLGVERLVGGVARLVHRSGRRPATVLLPLSPNLGGFGGDGPYPETKAALEVLLRRQHSERASWGGDVALIAARIGWVRGTGLMGGNDAVAALVENRLGVRTFTPEEMAFALSAVATGAPAEGLRDGPVTVDLTGGMAGLGDLRGAVLPLAAEVVNRSGTARRRHELRTRIAGPAADRPEPVTALPLPRPTAMGASSLSFATGSDHDADLVGWDTAAGLDPADLVVLVGTGELGPGGTARTRRALEIDGRAHPDGTVELAWACGLVTYRRDGYRHRWIDGATGDEVAEEDLAERYRDAVAERIGVRPLVADPTIDPHGTTVLSAIHLDRALTFEVSSEADARAHVAADLERTTAHRGDDGTWRVTLAPGAALRVPRLVPHTRRLAGQLPTGLDIERFGIPAHLTASADPMALVNLACTVEAFTTAGLTPEELVAEVHPASVANTQGSGMGGMASLRRLLLDHLLDDQRQPDRLQEALVNVVAAHAVQGYVGSYGSMVHPVAACATAAVSVEEAYDKIRAGKALAVLAGGYDDLTPEGMVGFADMHATASSDDLEDLGITPVEASRANDLRRRGFVEAQGGGASLVVRGDVAAALGLPVLGVIAYAASFADGIHTSIPAPGMGPLASALGGPRSPLASALARLGLGADDLTVVSKHDTSTEINDPNEAELHQRIQDALGRTPGNPLLVVSQKTVTGHAKGGAAAWQLAGLAQVLESGEVPGNANLEALDPAVAAAHHLAHGDRPIRVGSRTPLRAGLLTSLGFGHVSAVIALVHPDAFLATLAPDQRAEHRRRAARRRATGARRLLEARVGRPRPVQRTDRRLGPGRADEQRAVEATLLTDPDARPEPGR